MSHYCHSETSSYELNVYNTETVALKLLSGIPQHGSYLPINISFSFFMHYN